MYLFPVEIGMLMSRPGKAGMQVKARKGERSAGGYKGRCVYRGNTSVLLAAQALGDHLGLVWCGLLWSTL